MRYIFIFVIVLISCSRETQDHTPALTLKSSKFQLGNEKVLSSIKSYIDSSSDIPSIYALTIEREDLRTTSYKLSTIASYSQILETNPSAYFFLDNDLVIVYTGLERIVKSDDQFMTDLKNAIGDRIKDDSAKVFCPPARHYKLIGDSLADMGTVFDPLGPPIVNKIDFLPPKVFLLPVCQTTFDSFLVNNVTTLQSSSMLERSSVVTVHSIELLQMAQG